MAYPNDSKTRNGTPSARFVYRGLWVVCALLTLADFLYHKHVAFRIEEFPGFYGIFAFLVCIGLVMVAREAGKIVTQDEDYYDR